MCHLYGRRALATVPGTESIESKVALIQALIPLGLKAVAETLAKEVVALAGTRYSSQLLTRRTHLSVLSHQHPASAL